jgi:hypothetical protein
LRGNESRVLSAASFSRIDIGLSGEEIGRLVVWAARPGGRAGGGRGGRGTGGGTQTRGSLGTYSTHQGNYFVRYLGGSRSDPKE